MPRLWYPDRQAVEVVAFYLAEELFDDYESPMPAFSFLGNDRGTALLESALALPRQTFDGKALYRTLFDKAAVLMRSIIKNHPFIDGNKRMGLSTTALFLLMNRHTLVATPDEMVGMALSRASEGPGPPWPEISKWIRDRSFSATQPEWSFQRVRAIYGDLPEVDALMHDRFREFRQVLVRLRQL